MKKKTVQEDISCLIDGELGEFRTRTTLKALQADARTRDLCERYWLIGDVMRRLRVVEPDVDFAGSVAARLRAEPDVAVPGMWRRQLAQAARPAVGVALAASVMAVALLNVNSGSSPDTFEASGPLAGDTADITAPALARDPVVNGVQPIPAVVDDPSATRYAGLQTSSRQLQATRPVYYWEGRESRRQRYNTYLVKHNQYASRQPPMGFVNYARIVSADHEPVAEQQPEAQ